MYIDYDSIEDFEEVFTGEFYSPGGVANMFGISRQLIQQWIVRDVIDAHRYSGKHGSYVIVHATEFLKIKEHRKGKE